MDTTIIDEWASVKVPPPPELKQVTVNPKVTAYIILHIQKKNCNQKRPRCVASVYKIKDLLSEARAKGLPVIYGITAEATASDIREEVAPVAGEPLVLCAEDKFIDANGNTIVQSVQDQFHGTDLEKILRKKGINSVILVGTAAHQVILNTATGAALRNFQIIVPVDGMSSDDPYAEQYTAWHLVNNRCIKPHMILTRMSLIQILS